MGDIFDLINLQNEDGTEKEEKSKKVAAKPKVSKKVIGKETTKKTPETKAIQQNKKTSPLKRKHENVIVHSIYNIL